MVVANDLSKVKEETSEVIIIQKDKDPIRIKGHKEKIADILLDIIKNFLRYLKSKLYG